MGKNTKLSTGELCRISGCHQRYDRILTTFVLDSLPPLRHQRVLQVVMLGPERSRMGWDGRAGPGPIGGDSDSNE